MAKKKEATAAVLEKVKRLKINYNVVLVVLLIGAAFFVGRLSAQVEYLKGGLLAAGGGQTVQPTPQVQQPGQSAVALEQIKGLFNGEYLALGDKNRKVIFVEFSDPSCPYCHIAAGLNPSLNKQVDPRFTLVADGGTYVAPVPEMKKLLDQKKAAFVWIYANGHGNGEMGAKALYCANDKGKFWQAHDRLMTQEGYDLLNNVVKNDKAKSAELADFLKNATNYNEMLKCLRDGKYDNRIARDTGTATAMGFSGTPHFFINTTPFIGAYSFNDMKAVVDAALE